MPSTQLIALAAILRAHAPLTSPTLRFRVHPVGFACWGRQCATFGCANFATMRPYTTRGADLWTRNMVERNRYNVLRDGGLKDRAHPTSCLSRVKRWASRGALQRAQNTINFVDGHTESACNALLHDPRGGFVDANNIRDKQAQRVEGWWTQRLSPPYELRWSSNRKHFKNN